tara:strand:+ start:1449 stop:1667 length:219 start_codon:yes stop_codon:yes gene_type:complete
MIFQKIRKFCELDLDVNDWETQIVTWMTIMIGSSALVLDISFLFYISTSISVVLLGLYAIIFEREDYENKII